MNITFNTGPVRKIVGQSIGPGPKMVAVVYLAGWVVPAATNDEKYNFLTAVDPTPK